MRMDSKFQLFLAGDFNLPRTSVRGAGAQREQSLWTGVPAPSELQVSANLLLLEDADVQEMARIKKGSPALFKKIFPEASVPASSVLELSVPSPCFPGCCGGAREEHAQHSARENPPAAKGNVCHQQCRSRKWKISRLGIYLARASIAPSASVRAA